MDLDGGMNRYVALLFLSLGLNAMAQVPWPMDTVNSLEAQQRQVEVLGSERLDIVPGSSRWQHQGLGKLSFCDDRQFRLSIPVNTGLRAQGPADDPDYATFGRATVACRLHGRNLEEYNRRILESIYDL